MDYYKDAPDLATPLEIEGEDKTFREKKSKKRNTRNSNGSRKMVSEEGFTRFYINLGHKDNLTPPELIGLVNRSTRQRNVDVGKINIMRKFSFFEVDEFYTDVVLAGFKNIDFNKRKAVVEISKGNGNGNGNGDFEQTSPVRRKKNSKKRYGRRRL